MRVSKALSKRLMDLAFELRASGNELDGQVAAWILAHEKADRKEAGKRPPKATKVRLKQGGEAWLPLSMVRKAEREAEDEQE